MSGPIERDGGQRMNYVEKLREKKYHERHKRRQERKAFLIRENARRNRRGNE